MRICSVCGITHDNNHSYCVECMVQYSKKYYNSNKSSCLKKSKKYFQTRKGKFSKYKAKAKSRNIEFKLSYNNFIEFWQRPCFYCGSKINTIGIDRVNNNKGYQLNNIVSCCLICNKLKNNISILDWINYLNRLKGFFKNGRTEHLKYVYKDNRNYKIPRQFAQYRYSAGRRGKSFNISLNEFKSFVGVPCHYCGLSTNIVCLDRIDNNQGYEINNVVSCCKICNNGKNTLSYTEWSKHIKKLIFFDNEKLYKYLEFPMTTVPKDIKAADWKLVEIAKAHNDLNKRYFRTKEYVKYESYYKLGEALRWVMDQTARSNQLELLDIGCGAGWHAVYLEKEGFMPPLVYTGFDLSSHMCKLAKQNFPSGNFHEINICDQYVSPQYNIVMESAVLELVHDWKKALINMLKSSREWFISHRLFVKEGKTHAEQVTTYNNIPDVRFHIGMDDFKEVLEGCGFELVRSDLWHKGAYDMGTYVCRSSK